MKKHIQLLLLAFLLCGTAQTGSARDIGAYVSSSDSWMVSDTWNFINKFQGTQYVGSVPWTTSQYYYGAPYMLTSSNDWYADNVDLAYVEAHGAPYYMELPWPNTVNFADNSPFSNGLGNWDLEFLVLFSCSVVPSALNRYDWWTPWQHTLKGVHQILGFRTLAYGNSNAQNSFAWKLRYNGCVWQSWFDAMNENRYWWYNNGWQNSPGFASAIVYSAHYYDRLSSPEYPDPYGFTNLWNYYQY